MTLFSKIVGTGSYLPPKRVTNEDLAQQLALAGIETSDEWILSRSGISARHYVEPGVPSSELAYQASLKALEMAGMQANDIDLMQAKLGITNGAAAMDVNAVCSGFVYAMSIADSFIKTGAHKNVLIVGAEVFSRIIDFTDRTTCVLFGDGAGAVVMSASSTPGVLATKLHADGKYAGILCVPGNVAEGAIAGGAFLTMDGSAVFKLAVSVLDKVAHEVLEQANLQAAQVDWLVPHQANIRIMQGTAKKLGLPMEKMIVTVDQHGNTSAASIPLALDVAVRDGRIQPGQLVLVEGVGGGFTWGAALFRM